MNADALWDMMTAWIEFPLTIEWINFHESLDKMGHDAEILLEIFRDAELEPLCKGFKFVLQN
jgi:ribonuclease inhibitor